MSRSRWAWTESCGLVSTATRGAGRLETHEVSTRRGSERLARTISSITRLNWVTTVVMFVLVLSPAAALGHAGTPHSGALVAPATGGASQSRGTTLTATPNADPQHARSASADGRTPDQQVLAIGSGDTNNNGSTMVKALQRRLIGLGYSPGPVDGRYGPLTERAVIRFQAVHGLKVDGIAGPLTLAVLGSAKPVLYPGEGYTPGGSASVRRLQRELAAAGDTPGPIDGRYGPLTERAVMRFQAAHHLQIDGIAGSQTAGHLETALRARVRHQKRPVPATPVSPHQPSRPVPPTAGRARSHTGTVSPRSRRVSRSPGSLSTVWIILAAILAACLITAVLTAVLWRLRPRGGEDLPATQPRPGGGGPQVPEVRQAAGPREDLPDLTVPAVGSPARAAQLPADDANGHHEDQEVGAGAYSRGWERALDKDLVAAEDAFRRADERGHPAAAFELGMLLGRQGDRRAAKEAFRRADERGHPAAAFELGRLLVAEGDQVGAKEAFARAERRGHPDAAFDLGALLLQEGDHAGAEDSFRRAAERGNGGAACNLGVLLEQRGDVAGARRAYQRADDGGHAVATCNLGALLEEEGNVVGAWEAYRRADERGDPEGAYRLGLLLEREGDHFGAKDAYRRADQRGNSAGTCGLGLLLMHEGDRAGAVEALQRAGERGSREVADVAHAAMLELAGRKGER